MELSTLMGMMTRSPSLTMMPWPSMSTRSPCGIFLREIMSGGLDFLAEVMVQRVGFIQSGRVHPVTEHVHTFIIVLVKGPIGMKACRITMCLNGKNGTISYSLIRVSVENMPALMWTVHLPRVLSVMRGEY